MSYVRDPQQPMTIPIPGMQRQVGLGDVIAGITKAVGIQPCDACKRRQARLNNWLRFGRRP
jgi:hypothetical protein